MAWYADNMANTNEGPPYWHAQMPLLVKQHKPLPDVEKWQRSYVRYSTDASASAVITGWNKDASLRAQQLLPEADRQQVMMKDMPEQITMEITRAPVEFVVPVKQNRRFKPSFKVRVSVWHRQRVYLPVSVMAHAITEEEYDDIRNWIPPALDAAVTGEMVDRSTPTELKGCEQIHHTFDLQPACPPPQPVSRAPAAFDIPDYQLSNRECVNDFSSLHGSNRFWDCTMLALEGLMNEDHMAEDVKPPMPKQSGPGAQFAARGAAPPAAAPASAAGTSDLELRHTWYDFVFDEMKFARPSRMKKVFVVFSGQVSNVDIMFTILEIPTICFCRREQKERAYSILGIPYRKVAPLRFFPPERDPAATAPSDASAPPVQGSSSPVRPQAASSTQSHSQPSAEVLPETASAPHIKQDPSGSTRPIKRARDDDALGARRYTDDDMLTDGPYLNSLSVPGNLNGGQASSPTFAAPERDISEAAVRDFVEERYSATALARPLKETDMLALLELAGLPQGHKPAAYAERPATLTRCEFEDFQTGWAAICELLMKIRACWIATEPHVVCGFEIDHSRAVMALRDQPPGTFLCRFSLSQLGKLVLVCKVGVASPGADQDGLVHGLLNVNDLQDRQVDSWINDFPGATHLIDVYSGKRVDKRKAFPAKYTPLMRLHELHSGCAGSPSGQVSVGYSSPSTNPFNRVCEDFAHGHTCKEEDYSAISEPLFAGRCG